MLATLIPHGNYPGLPPQGQMLAIIIGLLLFLLGYGIYLTFGPGGEEFIDAIDEHAKMHELGIAHTHKEGTVRAIRAKEKNNEGIIMDFLKEIVKEIGDEYTQLARDIDDTESYIDTVRSF